MGKIILAREEDRGWNVQTVSAIFVFSLVIGVIGIPVGAVLSSIMQKRLNDSSVAVMYGFFLGPIFLGMLIGIFIGKIVINTKDHTKCGKCKGKMFPMSQEDLLFKIPVTEEKYKDAMQYLAKSMSRVSGISSIEGRQRGCYVCVYRCVQCANKIVRIKDFMPVHGRCYDMGTYYFDYKEFVHARGTDDLESQSIFGD